jgi:hypothetical protein
VPPVIYKDHRGNRLPSVTTIIGRFKESGGLLYWANQQGLEGKTLDQARAEVTTPGTLAHKAVEDHINGRPETALTGAGEVTEKARNAYAAYLHWEAMNRITFRHTEVALASEQYAFGGTLDAVGMIGNELILLDWKCPTRSTPTISTSSPPTGCSGTRIIPTTRQWVVSICAASPKSKAISPITFSQHSTTRPKPSC